jgi:hypothetical protein
MTDISRRLDSSLRKIIEKNPILPVKTTEGILVGTVLIVSNQNLKDLYQYDRLVYKEVSLNTVAIKLANMLAKNIANAHADVIYRADQEYGRWFSESQMLRAQYQRSLNNNDFERADTLWARYCQSREKALTTKKTAESLAVI